jgi:intracellular sulfur oxidation DsrE/DsrF family protein
MFNLDEALRNHLAQRKKEPKARFVAATVATLSPRSKPGRAGVVAAVADVATLRKTITSTTAVIQWLKEEGAHLYVANNTLCFRPTDLAQFAIVSAHWQALLHDLTAVDQEQKNGSGR